MICLLCFMISLTLKLCHNTIINTIIINDSYSLIVTNFKEDIKDNKTYTTQKKVPYLF